MEALALVKGAPLTRIGGGHCQQANRNLPGRASTWHGLQRM